MRIGLMSFAHLHAAAYAAALTAMPDIEVRASDPGHVERPDEAGGPSLATELGIGYAATYAELLAWQPDAVIICSENSRHRELTELAAAAGAHVLCEKPLATTVADGQAMIEACRVAGVSLMVAYPVRFSVGFAALAETYRSGALGEVIAVTGTNNGRIPLDSRAWFIDPELSGGGSITDHTVHVADLLDHLFDGSPAQSVYATSNQIMHAGDVSVETGGLVSIRYANGVQATIDCSWSKPDSYPTWGGLTLQLVGTEGIADLDAFGQRVGGHSNSQGSLWVPYGADADAALIGEFLDAVRTGRRPQPDGEVGLRTLAIVQAAYESVRTGAVVELVS